MTRGKDYYLGFDIGTDSVGWAVTDDNYNILKFHGKNMWGIRLFDEAHTAAERRVFRTNRRRIARRKWRIQLLQELFAEEISKVDPNFFMKLKESPLVLQDRPDGHIYTLFNDDDYTDHDYYKEYPTIYHLRKALMTEDKAFDIRLVYLAIHHIVKHRGHFLFHGSAENATSFHTAFETLKNCLKDDLEIELTCASEDRLAEVLKDKQTTKRDKQAKAIELLNVEKQDKQMKAIVGLICGSKCKLSDVFQDDGLKEEAKNSISFAEVSYDEIRPELEEFLQERCNILDTIKSVYDWTILSEILSGGKEGEKVYLSIAKVNLYDKHQKDLKLLKTALSYDRETYRAFFQKPGKINYPAYVGYTMQAGDKIAVKRCSHDEFVKEVKKLIEKAKQDGSAQEICEYILQEIEKDTFLPLQVSKDNGVIPYQIHELELKKILEKAGKYLPFLMQKDDDGITISEKILKLFSFRIPYYVGPLNANGSKNAWIVKNADSKEEEITPWNFEEKVNIDESAEKFIRRMTNKCTYLEIEDVLPKYSMLYSEFMVWNELNNVKLGADKLSIETKEKVFNELFSKKKKVSGKMLSNFLISEGYDLKNANLSGFDGNFKGSLTSYLDFKKIFGERMKEYSVRQMVEKIILWITLYGEEEKMLRRVIRKNYDEKAISDDELKKVCRLKYQGWGRLSEKFLCGLEFADRETGEIFNVMQALRKTNDNLMQLLSQKYNLLEIIEKENAESRGEITSISYDNLMKDLPMSPSVKRAVWQVILIAEEIRKIMGKQAKKIFVEVTRTNKAKKGDSGRKDSRKNQLLQLYQKCKEEERDWKRELEDRPESDFRSIKLYLYYTQMGRCMYSGEAIDLSRLSDAQVYDRDHIYPQSKTKDDSLDNLVLVKREINAKKGNGTISEDIQHKMYGFWKMLNDKGFISDEKYRRLMRKTPLTDEELAGFINRQLVEAGQSSKMVISLFKQIYEQSQIVYVKGEVVADFRHRQLERVKSRSLNDYHHAKDAYLNIVVGNVYNAKFTSNPLVWLRKEKDRDYSLNQVFNKDVIVRGNNVWTKGNNGTIQTIRKNYDKRDIQYTRQEIENKGGLFDQNPVRKDANASVPIKKGMDVSVYGGYKSLTPAYFCLLESEDKKGKKQRSIEAVPLYLKAKVEKDENVAVKYFEETGGLKNVKIIIPKIRKNAYLIIDGFPMHLRGTTGIGKQLSLQGAVQLLMPQKWEEYIKKLEKYIERNSSRTDKRTILLINEYDGISKSENLELYDIFCDKLSDTIYKFRPANPVKQLRAKRDRFEKLEVEKQCEVLNEILHLMQCKPITSNLLQLGESKDSGTTKKASLISKAKDAKLIHLSVTGLYMQVVDLQTV